MRLSHTQYPTRPEIFFQYPNPTRPEVEKPYPSDPADRKKNYKSFESNILILKANITKSPFLNLYHVFSTKTHVFIFEEILTSMVFEIFRAMVGNCLNDTKHQKRH